MLFFKNLFRAEGRILVAGLAAFCLYICMYAFRKPFTVSNYGGMQFWGVDYKIWLVVAQTIGYTLCKFYGIKFISEIEKDRRFISLLISMAVAWIALLFFAITPAPYNIIFLLLNGFPLGMIYGLVFSYLEGRRITELLGAILAASFIFAVGFSQSAGKYVLDNWNVGFWWMPFVTGAVFFVPLVFFSWLLNKTPEPDAEDIRMRTIRLPMKKSERKGFVAYFLSGVILLVAIYVLLTMLRDYRSNFASNMWEEMGFGDSAAVFTQSELLPSVLVLIMASSLIFVRNNFKAFVINHILVMTGFAVAIAASFLYLQNNLSPFWWMSLTSLGLYMGYVPFNSMLFERFLASFKYAGTVGFLIYLADSFGYVGSSLILFVRNFSSFTTTWVSFFVNLMIYGGLLGIALTLFSLLYFWKKYKHQQNPA